MKFKSDNGFTIIEFSVVIVIVGILSTVLLLNFRGGQANAKLLRAAAVLESELRRAQNLAIASSDFQGTVPCGYGINYLTDRTFRIYAGQLGGAADCLVSNHNYQPGIDSIYQDLLIVDPDVVFRTVFPDIFFEPPDPSIYINDSKDLGVSTTIEFCLEVDLTKCRYLTIDTAGKITIQ